MKNFLLLMIVLVSFTTTKSQTSQLLVNENFTDFNNGNLNTTSSGQGGLYPWSASSFLSSDFVQVAKTTPLYYAGYASGTQYINLTPGGNSFWPDYQFPDDPSKKFIGNTSLPLNAATTFYTSFVVNVPSASGLPATNTATPVMALATSGDDYMANFYIAKSGSQLKFGISKDNGIDGTYAGTGYNFNTTYLIVIRYDVVTGSHNDKMYLWVNPVITSEPATGSASASITSTANNSNNSDGYSTTSGNSVRELKLFQEQNSAAASFDAIKVAYAKNFSNNSLAAWNTLSPVGIPLPVKFGDINAAAKDKGVQVNWSVYTELNVDHYDIERSTDGVSFSKVGSVTASNREGTLYYEWFDASPFTGNNFYRIKNVDVDAKNTLSAVVRVNLAATNSTAVTIYPNPVTGNHVSFQAAGLQRGDYKIEIFNMAGQQVYTKQFSHAGGATSQSMELPSVKTGIYNMRITNGDYKVTKAFLIQ